MTCEESGISTFPADIYTRRGRSGDMASKRIQCLRLYSEIAACCLLEYPRPFRISLLYCPLLKLVPPKHLFLIDKQRNTCGKSMCSSTKDLKSWQGISANPILYSGSVQSDKAWKTAMFFMCIAIFSGQRQSKVS